MNYADVAPDNMLDFIISNLERLRDPYIIGQTSRELELAYAGRPYPKRMERSLPIRTMEDRYYKENRFRFPVNIPSWIDFLSGMDFVFGCRLHGNIAAILAGTPALMITKDYRMQELAEYHAIPWIDGRTVDVGDDVFRLIDGLDLKSPEKVHKENFSRFVSFLDSNGLDHIYKDGSDPERAPLDLQMDNIEYRPIVGTLTGCGRDELLERVQHFMPEYNNIIDRQKDKIKEMKDFSKEQKSELRVLQNTLNRRSVQSVLKISNALRRK